MGTYAKLIGAFILSVAVTLPAFGSDTFVTEVQAQQHCPMDIVVWLNLPSMIWHTKGQHWYARTQHGAYACEKEAAAGGGRASRNGQ